MQSSTAVGAACVATLCAFLLYRSHQQRLGVRRTTKRKKVPILIRSPPQRRESVLRSSPKPPPLSAPRPKFLLMPKGQTFSNVNRPARPVPSVSRYPKPVTEDKPLRESKPHSPRKDRPFTRRKSLPRAVKAPCYPAMSRVTTSRGIDHSAATRPSTQMVAVSKSQISAEARARLAQMDLSDKQPTQVYNIIRPFIEDHSGMASEAPVNLYRQVASATQCCPAIDWEQMPVQMRAENRQHRTNRTFCDLPQKTSEQHSACVEKENGPIFIFKWNRKASLSRAPAWETPASLLPHVVAGVKGEAPTQPTHDPSEIVMTGALQGSDSRMKGEEASRRHVMEPLDNTHSCVCDKDLSLEEEVKVMPWRILDGKELAFSKLFSNPKLGEKLPADYKTTPQGLALVLDKTKENIQRYLLANFASEEDRQAAAHKVDEMTFVWLARVGGFFSHSVDETRSVETREGRDPVQYPEDLVPYQGSDSGDAMARQYWRKLWKRAMLFWESVGFPGQYDEAGNIYHNAERRAHWIAAQKRDRKAAADKLILME